MHPTLRFVSPTALQVRIRNGAARVEPTGSGVVELTQVSPDQYHTNISEEKLVCSLPTMLVCIATAVAAGRLVRANYLHQHTGHRAAQFKMEQAVSFLSKGNRVRLSVSHPPRARDAAVKTARQLADLVRSRPRSNTLLPRTRRLLLLLRKSGATSQLGLLAPLRGSLFGRRSMLLNARR